MFWHLWFMKCACTYNRRNAKIFTFVNSVGYDVGAMCIYFECECKFLLKLLFQF